ncbi:MAG: hypothetical protein ABIK49_00690, partial [candidate division WOR-3 bacterium]
MLSENDREWVRAIVKAAIDEAVLAMHRECCSRLEHHVRTCPNIMQSRALVIGIGKGEHFLASDASPILEYTKEVVYVNDYQVAVVKS